MAIRYYDEAVAKKINSWLPKDKNRSIQILKPDETKKLFTIEADERDDKPLQLPLIALSRDTSIELKQRTMCPVSFDGLMLESDGKHTLQLNGIPIYLTYQMDIYTRHYDEGDELLREFVFKLVNNPQIVIELPYNGQNFKHVATILMQNTIQDNSDVGERLFSGQFTRWTIKFDIVGAYLFSIPYVDNVSIGDINMEVKDKNQIIEE